MQHIKRLLLCFALVLAQLTPAPATILFAGGEDIDFSYIGAVQWDTTAGNYRSTWSRGALKIDQNSGGVSDPPQVRVYTPTFAATSSLWLHTESQPNGNGTDTDQQVICAITANGNCSLAIRGNSGDQVKISTRTTGGVFNDLVTCVFGGFPVPVLGKLDWQINYSSTGSVNLYWNGVNICSFTGDVTVNSQTQLNQFFFASVTRGNVNIYWSEVIIATTDTRDTNLLTCAPAANGTTQNWTGTASNVNPLQINDSSAITTGSTNVIGNFTCGLAIPAGAYTVPAVVQSARLQGAPGTITNFRFNSRPAGSGADFDTSADISAPGIFTSNPNNVVTNNPATAGPWTTTTIGTGANFGVKSRP